LIVGVAKVVWTEGDRLQDGKYIIEKELGKGRFGITYLVKNQNGDRLVVKTLNDDLLQSFNQSQHERLETMFWQEAVKLARCRHQHIVQVIEVFKEGQKSCLVMEYIDGISLADRRQPILSETEAIRYIQQIGEALIVVHQERLIHRDIHPGNIFLRVRQGESEAVLIDFGLALEFDSVLTTKRAKQTSEGFTPLELYAQHTRPTGAYSDIYSLAATLYVLLTGKMPVSALQRKIRSFFFFEDIFCQSSKAFPFFNLANHRCFLVLFLWLCHFLKVNASAVWKSLLLIHQREYSQFVVGLSLEK
jgi:eukaryotic-like serine/threonine-protein kinase